MPIELRLNKPGENHMGCVQVFNISSDILERLSDKVVATEGMLDGLDQIYPGIKKELEKATAGKTEEAAVAMKSVITQELLAFLNNMALMYKERYYDKDLAALRPGLVEMKDANFGQAFSNAQRQDDGGVWDRRGRIQRNASRSFDYRYNHSAACIGE